MNATGNNSFHKKLPMIFAHIGDLHINKAKEQNYKDFLSIVAQLEIECSNNLDFVFLPGDIADHGEPEQYKMVSTALKMLSIPVHIIAGDHDMEQGSLDGFYKMLAAEHLPKSILIKNNRCIFLDVNGSGNGRPDFRLGNEQLSWLEIELSIAKENKEAICIFMHTYPFDLVEPTEKVVLNKLIAEHDVVLVDMGHTHYNELANDGHTIFSAVRSTGQIEEGPVGYSFISIDNGFVSWRFKQMEDPFPFVMITSPADYRLMRNDKYVEGNVEIRAVIFNTKNIKTVNCYVKDRDAITMSRNDKNSWSAIINFPSKELTEITVQAIDENGWPGQHTIHVASSSYKRKKVIQSGSDAASIGAWPENGIFGTQLGPNRNAKPSPPPSLK